MRGHDGNHGVTANADRHAEDLAEVETGKIEICLRNLALIQPGLRPKPNPSRESKRLELSLLRESQRRRGVKYFMGELGMPPKFQCIRLEDGTIETSIYENPTGPFMVDPELIEESEKIRDWLKENCEYVGNDPYIFARDYPVYKYVGDK